MNNSIVSIIERLRLLEHDHGPDGWPAVQMCDITACLDEIERLQMLFWMPDGCGNPDGVEWGYYRRVCSDRLPVAELPVVDHDAPERGTPGWQRQLSRIP